jgi:hypothetical protein
MAFSGESSPKRTVRGRPTVETLTDALRGFGGYTESGKAGRSAGAAERRPFRGGPGNRK